MHGEASSQRNEWTAGFVVTKASPVMVRPSELELGRTPTPSLPAGDYATVPLSSFDRRVPPMPATSLLVFERTIDEPVETIKRALSRALAHYRPMAGRLDGAGGIACTDEGVTFVGAAASCALKEATTRALQEMDLAVCYPGLLCRDAEPLLLVQVTEFACGGFVVGVTSNHVAADGLGMAQFLKALGELARGTSPPSCIPVRSWDESLPVSSAIPAAKGSMEHHDPQHLATLDIVIPSDLISRIKADDCCSVLDAVMAVLWRCRTRATMSPCDAESPAPLKFACNMRAHAGAPAGYYGNCIRVQVVRATAGVVASSGIGHLVGLIRRVKEMVPDLLSTPGSRAEADHCQGQHAPPPSLWYETFTVTDWRNLGLDAVDFGGGPPERVLLRHDRRAMVPSCVVCPRSRAKRHECDGVFVSSKFVKPQHVDALLAELAALVASG
ncbi:Acyl transferase 15-like [Zea mays]|jgi:hypothetical protein|uniref:HXXXD-type acyl-transferase family protein n=1 Tax=Zea mays TaxID=4577 RepID=C0P5S2_MAIZE|nr:Acyl transferase 15-like [Zea mays]ACN28338.1 unknown [Zea mays]ONM19040.1 HXXXD-type acyl-transferase family protein [Zea mays]|eukprot:NP_001168474.1 uncharacterized protein LOC100382250 [Zea mays]